MGAFSGRYLRRVHRVERRDEQHDGLRMNRSRRFSANARLWTTMSKCQAAWKHTKGYKDIFLINF